MALFLDVSEEEIDKIDVKYGDDTEACCTAVFSSWLKGGGSEDYPTTWGGVFQLLEDIECSNISEELKEALSNFTQILK